MNSTEMRATIVRLERAYRFNKQQKTYYYQRFAVYNRFQDRTGRDCSDLVEFYHQVFNHHFLAMTTAYAELRAFRELCHKLKQAHGGGNGTAGRGGGPEGGEAPGIGCNKPKTGTA